MFHSEMSIFYITTVFSHLAAMNHADNISQNTEIAQSGSFSSADNTRICKVCIQSRSHFQKFTAFHNLFGIVNASPALYLLLQQYVFELL